jgi:acyl-CoA thioester hydrolase
VFSNNGYNLGHSSGHGKQTLAGVFLPLNLRAFAFHTAAQPASLAWREAACGATNRCFETLHTITACVVFQDGGPFAAGDRDDRSQATVKLGTHFHRVLSQARTGRTDKSTVCDPSKIAAGMPPALCRMAAHDCSHFPIYGGRRMHPPAISLDQVANLPEIYRTTIPPAYEDRNGHMNIRWYLVIYDEAGDVMYPMLGLTDAYFAASGMGGFDLEHHIWYLSEVGVGDTVAIRLRMLARGAKLCHYMMFMVNETRGRLASMFECVHAHADLRARRTAAFPDQAVAAIDGLIADQATLGWPAPISGAMAVKSAAKP